MSSVTQSRMLRFFRSSLWRSFADPPSPNRRSKITRGSASVGSGFVGEDHDKLFWYTQAYPLSQLPTIAMRSVPSSSDGICVSLPICFAIIWSIDVDNTYSLPSVLLASVAVGKEQFAV